MSKAFTSETAPSAPPPERMIEEGPNPVTPEGMKQIDDHIARIEGAMKSENNVLLRETLARDLRYWTIRKSTAEIVQPVAEGTVTFGSTVTVERKGRQQTFRILQLMLAHPTKIFFEKRRQILQLHREPACFCDVASKLSQQFRREVMSLQLGECQAKLPRKTVHSRARAE